MNLNKFLISTIFLISSNSFGYFLSLATVLEKVSQKSGKGGYELIQEVTVQNGESAPLNFTETWIIDGSQKQRVLAKVSIENQNTNSEFKTPGALLLNIDFFLDGEKKIFNKNGKLFSQKKGEKFIYPLFFENKSEDLFEHLKNLGFFLSNQKFSAKDITFGGRLGRYDGVPQLVYGDENKVWIEQDQNVLRKFYFGDDKVTVTMDEYSEFRRGLHFPKVISYKWEQGSAQIHVQKISALSAAQTKKLMDRSALTSNDLETQEGEISESLIQLKKFYNQLR